MQLLIDIKGHGRVPDDAISYLKSKVEALQAAAAEVGLALRADFAPSQPEPAAVAAAPRGVLVPEPEAAADAGSQADIPSTKADSTDSPEADTTTLQEDAL